jgi:hypothetical protein
MAVGLFLAVSAGFARAQQSWQTFNCPDGKCSVLLPVGKVSSSVASGESTDMVVGDTNELSSFEVDLADNYISYELIYGDYPSSYADSAPSYLLSQVFFGTVKGLRVFYHRMINLNGVPGQAFAISTTDGWLCQVRQYYNSPRLYQLFLCTGPGHEVPSKDVETFLNSLSIR